MLYNTSSCDKIYIQKIVPICRCNNYVLTAILFIYIILFMSNFMFDMRKNCETFSLCINNLRILQNQVDRKSLYPLADKQPYIYNEMR